MNILRYVSDLHLELRNSIYHKKLIPLWVFNKGDNDKYYLALVGDIGNPFNDNLSKFLSIIAPKYDKIFYIPGNHEYYNLKKNITRPKNEYDKKLEEICSTYSNVILMNNGIYNLDGIKIIGSTLWSNVSKENEYISRAINDYHLIYKQIGNHTEKITIDDTNKWNKESIDFISNELSNSETPCIVLTHHAPLFSNRETSQFTANPSYLNGKANEAFHNNLTEIIKYPVVAWLYGHTHFANKFTHNGVLVATNQLGYYDEESSINFDSYAYIDLNRVVLDSL